MVGDLLGAELGDVADEDAELGRVGDIDVVDADPVAGDGETPIGGVENLRRHPAEAREDGIRLRGEGQQVLVGLRQQDLVAGGVRQFGLDRRASARRCP